MSTKSEKNLKGRIAAGERVTWFSNGKVKHGKVLQFLPGRVGRYEVRVDGESCIYTPYPGVLERANPRARREAGVIVPELLLGLAAMAGVGLLVTVAVAIKSTWLIGLMGVVATSALWLWPAADLAAGREPEPTVSVPPPPPPAPPVRPAPRPEAPLDERAPSLREMEHLVLEAPAAVPLEVVRLKEPRPERQRRHGSGPFGLPGVTRLGERGHTVTELMASVALFFAVLALAAAVLTWASCAAALPPGYTVRYGGAGAGISATIERTLDRDAAEQALRAVAEPLASCASYTVRVDQVTCPPPKDGKEQLCTVLGAYTCGAAAVASPGGPL